jgi:hypothetical protein
VIETAAEDAAFAERAPPPDRAAGPPRTTSSTSEAHSPHDEQRPSHFALEAPHF